MADEGPRICVICLCELDGAVDNPMALTCGHLFHELCVTTYCQVTSTDLANIACPTCKTTSLSNRVAELDTELVDLGTVESSVVDDTLARGELDHPDIDFLFGVFDGSHAGSSSGGVGNSVGSGALSSTDPWVPPAGSSGGSGAGSNIDPLDPLAGSSAGAGASSNTDPWIPPATAASAPAAAEAPLVSPVDPGPSPAWTAPPTIFRSPVGGDNAETSSAVDPVPVVAPPPPPPPTPPTTTLVQRRNSSVDAGSSIVPHQPVDACQHPKFDEPKVYCNSCGSEVVLSRCRVMSKSQGLWRCNKCNCKVVKLWRHFGTWPTKEFSGLDLAAKQAFMKQEHADGKDAIAHATKLMQSREVHESYYTDGGEFLPLGVYKVRGYDVEAIERSTPEEDKRWHPVVGWTFRLRIIGGGTRGNRGTEFLETMRGKRRRVNSEAMLTVGNNEPGQQLLAPAPPAIKDGAVAEAASSNPAPPSGKSSASSSSSSSESDDSPKTKKKKKEKKKLKKKKKADKRKKKEAADKKAADLAEVKAAKEKALLDKKALKEQDKQQKAEDKFAQKEQMMNKKLAEQVVMELCSRCQGMVSVSLAWHGF